MKRLFLAILFLFLLLLPCMAGAATYYVSAGGSDTSPYDTWAKASTLIATINGIDFADGDEIHIRPGDTFTDASLTLAGITSASGKAIVVKGIDGDGKTLAGDGLPWLGGNAEIRPVNISVDGLDLTLKDFRVDGQDWWTSTKTYACFVEDADDVVIDGVDADGSVGYPGTDPTRYKNAIGVLDCTGSIEIKNCVLQKYGDNYNWAVPGGPESVSSTDYQGIYVSENEGGAAKTIKIHDNTISYFESDGIQIQENGATVTTIYANAIKNCGENGIDNKGDSYVTIYENQIYRETTYTGAASGAEQFALINIIGDDAKENSSTYVTVKDNLLDDGSGNATDREAFYISGSSSYRAQYIRVFRNKIGVAKIHFKTGNKVDSSEIHHNICIGLKPGGHFIRDGNGAGAGTDTKYYFNSFYHNTDDMNTAAFYLWKSKGEFVGNSVYMNSGTDHFVYEDEQVPTFPACNIFYNAAGTGTFYWSGGSNNLATFNARAGNANNVEDNPDYTSATDLTLQAGAPGIDAADFSSYSLTHMDGYTLHSNSAWTFGAFDINTVAQLSYGSSPYYEVGAFAYITGDPPATRGGYSGTYALGWGGEYTSDTDKACFTSGAATKDGTVSGATIDATGKYTGSYGITLTANDQYVSWPISGGDGFHSSAYTVGMRIKCVTTTGINTPFEGYFDGDDKVIGYILNTGALCARHMGNNVAVIVNGSQLTDNTWHQIRISGSVAANMLSVKLDDNAWDDDADDDPVTVLNTEPSDVKFGESNAGYTSTDTVYIDDAWIVNSFKADPPTITDPTAADTITDTGIWDGTDCDCSASNTITSGSWQLCDELSGQQTIGGNPDQAYRQITPDDSPATDVKGRFNSQQQESGGTWCLIWDFTAGYTYNPTTEAFDADAGQRDAAIVSKSANAVVLNTAVIENGNGVPLTLTGANSAAAGTAVLAALKTANDPWTIGPGGGDYPAWQNGTTGFLDVLFSANYDWFAFRWPLTDDVDTDADQLTFDIRRPLTGAFTLDQDNCRIIGTNMVSGGVTNTGSGNILQKIERRTRRFRR